MAVTLLRNTVKVAGTAAERTAYDISKITVGSTFFEWDTSDLYVLAPTGWVKKNGVVQIDGGNVELTGSNVELASAQDAQVVGTEKSYNRAEGASRIEVYCESGYIRVRTDGQPATSTTGEPIAAGFAACWNAESVSVYFIQESIITVVSR